ncbi:FMN-dependent dehydrogenase [Halteromyces radiatus]|uniref:FMN-dependent dehydrogenase n=1 Tax=Halteromyces radiatus TaxID=101107 RepID=UPI00222115C2|nr:FMN-dependent dehydrogenase [Halteromyces radiatus]KAI8079947.1 FMN-dependent dehydrogenase [Halteromyces radiatus]
MPNHFQPITIDDFEALAQKSLNAAIFGYFSSGADSEMTLQRNRQAYDQLLIRPKILVDVEKIDISTTILGQHIQTPIGFSPTAFHQMAHDDGELATARASASLGTCYCAATYSNYSMDDIQKAAQSISKDALQWFQLYVEKDREVTAKLVRHCEKVGYKALVVTVDRPRLGRRLIDTRTGFKLPSHLRLGNFSNEDDDDDARTGEGAYLTGHIDASLSWADLAWLRSLSSLPIVLKGIFRAEDARLAIQHGVSGLIVSNHGGRQLDGCPATLEVLPEIVDACKNTNVEVYIDGGIRKGTDVFKALALGARAVFIGRPVLWGLAYDGENGIKRVLNHLNYDLRLAMALAGTTSIDSISSDYVVPSSYYSFENKIKSKL